MEETTKKINDRFLLRSKQKISSCCNQEKRKKQKNVEGSFLSCFTTMRMTTTTIDKKKLQET